MDSTITISGNLTRPVELKFLPSGQPSARFAVAVNRRWQNRKTQEWEEATSYFNVEAYGPLAENAANSLSTGDRVLVSGRLEERSWTTDTGDKRSVIEIKADEIGPSLRYATASVAKVAKTTTGGSYGGSATNSFSGEDAF